MAALVDEPVILFRHVRCGAVESVAADGADRLTHIYCRTCVGHWNRREWRQAPATLEMPREAKQETR